MGTYEYFYYVTVIKGTTWESSNGFKDHAFIILIGNFILNINLKIYGHICNNCKGKKILQFLILKEIDVNN